jgi:aminoglycoside/choline kinase family phosphotransferase
MELSDSARAKLDQAKLMRSNLLQENSKIKLSIENVKHKINEFKPELMSVDIKILEEEYTALLSDESGEAEYLSSLQSQAEKLKGISYIAKCGCGEEYSVGLD